MRSLRTIAVDLTPLSRGGENGGAKVFTLLLLRHLIRLYPRTRFVLITNEAAYPEVEEFAASPNVHCMIVDPGKSIASATLPRRRAWLSWALGEGRPQDGSLMDQIGADVLFCPLTNPSLRDANIPTVCNIYDLQYSVYPEFFSREEYENRQKAFAEISQKANVIATASNYVCKTLIERGIDKSRISVIPIELTPAASRDVLDSSELLRSLGLTTKKFILYPANFWPHKNHEMLLTAMQIARSAGLGRDVKLVCTGSVGAATHYLAKAASALGLDDAVAFPGFVRPGELAALLEHAAALVFPSLYEGFGMPVLEAMAAGCPVACSDRASLPETAGGAALLFDPRKPIEIANALIRVTQDDDLRAKLIAAGHRHALQFSHPDRMAAAYWDLFGRAQVTPCAETALLGVYEDGWIGPVLDIQYGPGTSRRFIELNLVAPGWFPAQSIRATVVQGAGLRPWGRRFRFKTSTSRTLRLPIGARHGRLKIRFDPCFRPSDITESSDERRLAVMLRSLNIRSDDGATTLVFAPRLDPYPESVAVSP